MELGAVFIVALYSWEYNIPLNKGTALSQTASMANTFPVNNRMIIKRSPSNESSVLLLSAHLVPPWG